MGRPVDPARRAQLLQAAVDYVIANGLADLTLRPLAEALGVLPNTLVHHFGSKEELLSEILNGVRDRLRAMRDQLRADPEGVPLQGVWDWASDAERHAFFRSFFEAYGIALARPQQFPGFLARVVADWLPESGAERATLELAVVRGLLLDLLTTDERDRIDGAFALFSGLAGAASGEGRRLRR